MQIHTDLELFVLFFQLRVLLLQLHHFVVQPNCCVRANTHLSMTAEPISQSEPIIAANQLEQQLTRMLAISVIELAYFAGLDQSCECFATPLAHGVSHCLVDLAET